MAKVTKNIPIYGLDSFRSKPEIDRMFQVEVFDANRHFKVSYPHRHNFYEILFIQQGSGYYIIDDKRYDIKPPCIFFLSQGQIHTLSVSLDIQGFIFLFTSEFYDLFNASKNELLQYPFFFSTTQDNPPLYVTKESDNKFLSQLLERCCLESYSKEKTDTHIIHSLLQLFLLLCNKLYNNSISEFKQSRGQFLVKQFFVLLEKNYQSTQSIQFYADNLGITPNHLTQVIKQVMGKNTISLIQEKRIIEIKRLLIHSNMNICQIAEQFNFTDVSYFTKYFKKNVGMTPIKYRKLVNP